MPYRDWLVFNSFDWCILILTVLMGCSLSSLLFHSSSAVVFLDRGIHAAGISIPPSLLTLLGWSLMWITSLTLHVYQMNADHETTSVLPYVEGLSKQLRHCLQQQGIRTVFKCETTLRSHLVRPKHPATRLNKTVLFTEFRVIAAKFTSARVEDLWKTG